MKKFTKICLIIAAVFAVAGVSFCVAAVVCGVDFGELRSIPFFRVRDYQVITDGETEEPKWTGDSEYSEYEETYDGIRKLDLELGVTDMQIVQSDDDRFHVYAYSPDGKFDSTKNGDTLKIESNTGKKHLGNLVNVDTARVTLEVPAGVVFDEVEMDVGVGNLQAEALVCRELDISCGVGNVAIDGYVTGECDIECGVGEVVMNLGNRQKDFNYRISCGIGNVVLGEDSYSGISSDRKIDNGAGNTMEIECGMGSVILSFANEYESSYNDLQMQDADTASSHAKMESNHHDETEDHGHSGHGDGE